MKTERYSCDREGCHAVSNGVTANWWAVSVSKDHAVVVPLGKTHSADYRHFCGMEHAIAEVQDAMRGMQKP